MYACVAGFKLRSSLLSRGWWLLRITPMATENQETSDLELDSEVEVEEEEQGWGDWNADDEEGEDDLDSDSLCLFCDSKYSSSDALLDHCNSIHHFDFHGIRKALGLDFYGCFKLINYVRSQVL